MYITPYIYIMIDLYISFTLVHRASSVLEAQLAAVLASLRLCVRVLSVTSPSA